MSIHDLIKLYEKKYFESMKWRYKRILIIDDEEFCISAMIAMLKTNGIDTTHIVDISMNGKEAIK